MRLFWRVLKSKVLVTLRSLGKDKAPGVKILLGAFALLLVLFFSFVVMLMVNNGFRKDGSMIVTMNEMAVVSGAMLFFILITITIADFAFAHTQNVGQRTQDVEFLLTLPMTFNQFFAVKMAERALTDWISLIVLLPCILGCCWSTAGLLVGTVMGLYAYLLLQVALSSLLLCLNFTLARFLSRSQLKATLAWGSLCGVGLLFAGPILITRLTKVVSRSFLETPLIKLLPSYWGSSALLLPRLHRPWLSLAYFSLCTAVAILLLWTTQRIARGFRRRGWSYREDIPTMRLAPDRGMRRWLAGYYWKELLMLLRDQSIVVNAVALPLLVSVIVLYFWGQLGLPGGSSPETIVRIASGGLIFFHFFGAINAAGSEGRSIGLISTLPVTPARFLAKKVVLWGTLGCLVMIPFFWIYFFISLPTAVTFGALASGAARLAAFSYYLALVGVALSVPFADYEASVIQRASTMTGKICFSLCAAAALFTTASGIPTVAFAGGLLSLLLAMAAFRYGAKKLRYPHNP